MPSGSPQAPDGFPPRHHLDDLRFGMARNAGRLVVLADPDAAAARSCPSSAVRSNSPSTLSALDWEASTTFGSGGRERLRERGLAGGRGRRGVQDRGSREESWAVDARRNRRNGPRGSDQPGPGVLGRDATHLV
jgi:hypothetical protein